jgi:acyltransferase-like protein
VVAESASRSVAKAQHLHWVDWLKVLAILGVFYYHSAMIFAMAPWMIANRERSVALTVVAGTGFFFGMPLLFLLSGAASTFAVRTRSVIGFVRLRFARLVIPMVAGFIVLSPLQAWFVLASKGQSQPFWDYFPTFFVGIQWYLNPRWFGTYGYHLWFLGFLFLYSVLIVPLILALRRPTGHRLVSRLADLSDKPGGLFAFVLPLAAVQIALRARFPWYQDWTDFLYLLVFFAWGYVILSERRFVDIIARRAASNLVIAVAVGLGFALLAGYGLIRQWELYPGYSPGFMAYEVIRTTVIWAWVLFLLAFAIHRLNFTNRFLKYSSEAVMPFYVLHHPVIVVVGYFVIQWPANLWFKHGVITLAALAATVAIYEVAIRRFAPMRWFFGMRPLPPRRPAPVASPPVAISLRKRHA